MIVLMLVVYFLQTPAVPKKPLGRFDEGKPASPQSLKSVGTRGAVDGGGYAASASAKTQIALFRELVDLQAQVTRTVWTTDRPCASEVSKLEARLRAEGSSKNRQLLALSYESDGQLDAAVEQLRIASATSPDEIAMFQYVLALLLAGDQKTALDAFPSATSLLSAVARGAVLFQDGDADGALSLFLRYHAYRFAAVAVASASPTAIGRMIRDLSASKESPYALACARMAAHDNDTGEIARELQEALRREPDLTEARLRLAAQYATLGNTKTAISEYLRVIKEQPDLPDAHYRLGQLYMRNGEATAAKEQLQLHQQARAREDVRIASGRVPFPGCAALVVTDGIVSPSR